MSISSPAQITPQFVHCPAHLLDNISGTRTSSDMILDSYMNALLAGFHMLCRLSQYSKYFMKNMARGREN